MATSLQRAGLRLARFHRSTILSTKSFSSEAAELIEYRPGEIGKVSGIPDQHLRRRVVIYSPARVATQQGAGKVGKWKINFLSTQKWENPLMGWTSTGDPYANVSDSALTFDTEEAARSFAERHGWQCVVKKRHTPLLKESRLLSFSITVFSLKTFTRLPCYLPGDLDQSRSHMQTTSSGRAPLSRKIRL